MRSPVSVAGRSTRSPQRWAGQLRSHTHRAGVIDASSRGALPRVGSGYIRSSAGTSLSSSASVHEHEHGHDPSDGEVSVCDEAPDDADMFTIL